jgi:hypothetical protein
MAATDQPENPQEAAGATKTATSPARVCISHSSPAASLAAEVCEALERNTLSCRIAPRDIVPGKFYAGQCCHEPENATGEPVQDTS